MSLKITVLGSGTSSGVPTIGCHCPVCSSSDARDIRLRPSILIQHDGSNIVIDTTPDFRAQVLRAHLDRLDAIVFTHAHADHIMGLDDIRPFNYHQGGPIPIYVSAPAFATIERVFAYVFEKHDRQTTIPKLTVNLITDEPFEAAGVRFEPIPITHGHQTIFGFRFGNAAYLTDHSSIPESSLDRLHGLDVLFLDALRHRPHPTHSTVADALHTVSILKPRRTYLTHICHDLGHTATQATLPEGVFMAWDGLEIEVDTGIDGPDAA
jgi:phosphoribosyl 1,2-cyclic phosphate phosphodiesterase